MKKQNPIKILAALAFLPAIASEFHSTGPLTPESEAARLEIMISTVEPESVPDPWPTESIGSSIGRLNLREVARREMENPKPLKREPFVAPYPPLSEIRSAANSSNTIQLSQAGSAPVRIPVGDFNFDFWPDLVWRHAESGDNAIWFMKEGRLESTALVSNVADSNWEIKGAQKFDFDGIADLLWRHRVTGQNAIWHMDGRSLGSVSLLPTVTDTNWTVAATHTRSIVWRHQKTGQNALWRLNGDGTEIESVVIVPSVEDLNWQIALWTDLDSDSQPDLIWRNDSTGENAVWYMEWTTSEARLVDAVPLERVSDIRWRLVATADFNKDRTPDLVWRHEATGENAIWLLQSQKISSVINLPQEVDQNWRIVGPK